MIEPEHEKLSIARQCELTGISRSSWYYRPCGDSDLNLRLMCLIDAQYLKDVLVWLKADGAVLKAARLLRGTQAVASPDALDGPSFGGTAAAYLATGAAASGLCVSA